MTIPPGLVDSHVHLDRYDAATVVSMLERADGAGVRRLLTVGVDRASSQAAVKLALNPSPQPSLTNTGPLPRVRGRGSWPEVLAAVGIHPRRLAEAQAQGDPVQALRHLLEPSPDDAQIGRPHAIGEVGLDDAAPDLAGQARFLEACLSLAAETELPLVLHVVGAPSTHALAVEILARQARQRAPVQTVVHYFVGDAELSRQYVDLGCWIAVGKPVTRPADTVVRGAIPAIPLDRLLLETDTYPLPGRTTEPRDVADVCAAVADLTGRSYQEVAEATTANFERFIGRPEQTSS